MSDPDREPLTESGERSAESGERRPDSLAQVFAEQFSFEQAIGGPRGLVEAVVPMTLFSVVFGAGGSMRTAVIAAVASSVVFAIGRLVSRQPLTHALSGVLGIALGAVIAMRTGRPENFVVPSLFKNSAQLAVFGLSALTRWPLLGLLIGLMRNEGLRWRADRAQLRAYRLATWVWAAMFAVRLAVQVPLWRMGAVSALGFANVVLGLPLFGVVLWLTWAIVRDHHAPTPADPAPAVEPGAEQVRPDASPG